MLGGYRRSRAPNRVNPGVRSRKGASATPLDWTARFDGLHDAAARCFFPPARWGEPLALGQDGPGLKTGAASLTRVRTGHESSSSAATGGCSQV